MNTTSPYFGDGFSGPGNCWTPDIEAVTAAYSAPLGWRWPRIRGTGKVRQMAAGLAVVACLAVPAVTAFGVAPVTTATTGPQIIGSDHPADTWV